MTSNPSDSDVVELTSDSEEEDNTNSEEDESEISGDICVRDTCCARLLPILYFAEGSPISLKMGSFGITGLLRVFFSVAFCSTRMPQHRGPWNYRVTYV